MYLFDASSFSGSMWFIPFFSLMGCHLVIQELGYKATRVFGSGWIDYFGGQVFLYIRGLFK